MPRLERKHSLATRLFHWINAPVLAVMYVIVIYKTRTNPGPRWAGEVEKEPYSCNSG